MASFKYSNDFHSRLKKSDRELLVKLDEDPVFHQFYINGFPPGRMSAMHIKSVLDKALNNIWNLPKWGFNKPQNLFEVSAVLELYFHIVSELFKMSEYNALYIGGKIQSHLIPVPQNIDKNKWGPA